MHFTLQCSEMVSLGSGELTGVYVRGGLELMNFVTDVCGCKGCYSLGQDGIILGGGGAHSRGGTFRGPGAV
jgi:hypothetical protein